MKTWVYGKVHPGWYCARQIATEWYTNHLRKLGYEVVESQFAPPERT